MKNHGDLQWIEINAAALCHNVEVFRSFLGQSTTLMPVVKANAYGHGLSEIAKSLRGVRQLWGLAVAGGGEAAILQKANIRCNILVLSYYTARDLLHLPFPHSVAVAVSNTEQIALVRSVARKRGVPIRIHLKFDVGTGRIGFLPPKVPSLVRLLHTLRDKIIVEGIFSHLAEAESADQKYTRRQTVVFQHIASKIERLLRTSLVKHIACSAAIVMEQSTHFDIARLGIGLYGIWPSRSVERFAKYRYPTIRLQPVLQWKTRLLEVKSVAPGATIGYGRAFRANHRLRYGVVPVGYADGYLRSLSNSGIVLVRGRKCRVIGRVCMNLLMVDLTNVPNATSDDIVVLIGNQGKETVTADVLASRAQTISYELVCRLSQDIPRYVV